MSITLKHQKLAIADLRSIEVTEIVEDGAAFTRAVRFFTEVEGADDPVETLEVVITSETRGDLEILAPTQKF